MLKEFKKFALRGSMIDLAVGMIIGGAFSGIVNSLVNDIFMPILSLFTNNINFNNLFIPLEALDGKTYATLADAQAAGVATINYGLFISGIINFMIMAFVVFMFVKGMNKLQKPAEKPAATTKKCTYCLSDIAIKAVRCPHCTSDLSDNK